VFKAEHFIKTYLNTLNGAYNIYNQVSRLVGNHSVTIDSESHLASLLGTSVLVNSYQQKAIKDLSTDVVATAWSTDGLAEAYEAKDHAKSIVAVQWHPELVQATDEKMQGLFDDFIERACS